MNKLYLSLLTPGVLMGTSVGIVNMYNKNLSPIFDKNNEENDSLKNTKFFGGCIIKGCIYGSFYPFAAFGLMSDIFSNNKKDFEKHFVLFSKYGSYSNSNLNTKHIDPKLS